MKQKVIKVGNSLGVTVPSGFVKAVGVNKGDDVEVVVQPESGRVVYKFRGVRQLAIPQQSDGKTKAKEKASKGRKKKRERKKEKKAKQKGNE